MNRSKSPKYQELAADLSKHSIQEIVNFCLFSLINGGITANLEKIRLFVTFSQGSSCQEQFVLAAEISQSPLITAGNMLSTYPLRPQML